MKDKLKQFIFGRTEEKDMVLVPRDEIERVQAFLRKASARYCERCDMFFKNQGGASSHKKNFKHKDEQG